MKIALHYIRKYPLSVICITLIWILSLTPFFPETPLDNVMFIDKWAHFVMYGGTCGVLWIEYLRQHDHPDYKKLFFWAWMAPIIMSGVIELLQEYCTETRNGDWLDLSANAVGVTLGAVFGLTVLKIKNL